jgi:serine/threonine-protein kinase
MSEPEKKPSAARGVEDRDDSEIELEPTIAPGSWGADPRSSPFTLATSAGSMASMAGETAELLRSRLQAAALFLAVAYGLFVLLGLFQTTSIQAMFWVHMAIRMSICIAVAALLASRMSLSLGQLRLLEYGFFGAMVVSMIVTQYVAGSTLIAQGDALRLAALEKNGVLNFLALMVLYGVLIPNSPEATARVVLTMAMGPLVILAALRFMVNGTPLESNAAIDQFAVANTLFILLSAGLAIFAAYTLHHLRRDLHHARKLGQYQLGEKLGEGGMGEVYLAEHQLLKRPAALKLIKPDVDSNPIAVARFEREVQSAAMLSHPSTIQIFDYGHTDDGTFYYVMEYLPGLSLSDLVRQFGPLDPGRIVYLIRQVCGALAEAHRYGLVHRDLKPANILVAILGGQCDVAKVLDFGLVKLTASPGVPQLTADYTVSGTPQYMSPEQATASEGVDGRADIYSLGGILYFLLTGRPPFEGTNPTELMIAHARDPVVPPSRHRADCPSDLEAVVLRCLAKKPEDRYPDTRALAAALADCDCAGDWTASQAEDWWLERAASQVEPAAATPA